MENNKLEQLEQEVKRLEDKNSILQNQIDIQTARHFDDFQKMTELKTYVTALELKLRHYELIEESNNEKKN